MNPGRLRHQVHLQAATRVPDAGGGGEQTWADVAGPLFAEVRPLSGGEAVRGLQVSARVTHLVRIRWRAGVSPKMRVRFGARRFEVLRVIDPDERRAEMELLCEEVTT